MEQLVKSKHRVKNFGEVFTPINIVNDMLDTIPETISKEMTFLEPTCGEGVFLIEILKRKLKNVDNIKDCIWCISTLYGIDIQKDNVNITKEKLLDVWKEWSNKKYDDYQQVIENILNTNIILGDFLNDNIEIISYEFSEEGDDVIIKNQNFSDIIIAKENISSFFDMDETIKKYWEI